MRKSAFMALVLCSVIMLFSCEDSDTMATVKIDLGGNAAILPQQQQPNTIIDRVLRFFATPAYAAPDSVKLIVVTATGKDMIPVVKSFDPSTQIASLMVPEGKNRYILVRGYNGIGRAIYAGRSLVDLKAGEVKFVAITMRQTLRQIADINPGTGDSLPFGFTLFNKKVYFSATDATYGRELWAYNPLTEAVSRVTDINTTGDSNPTGLTVFQNRLYFRASDDDLEYDLWVYDDANGAQKAHDFVATRSDDPANLTVIDDRLYFAVNTEITLLNTEMCVYDGVTFNIVEVYTDTDSSNPNNFLKYGDTICFTASDYSTRSNFCTYNVITTAVNTFIDFSSNEVTYPKIFNGNVYFSADYAGADRELYRYDGNTVAQVYDLYASGGSNPSYLSVVDDFLFFLAADDGVSTGFWGYNGVEPAVAGVNLRLTSDLVAEGIINPEFVSAINHVLYFRGDFLTQSWLCAYIPLIDMAVPIYQIQVGQDSIKKLGSTAITFTDGDEATDVYVLDPSSALGTGSFPDPVKLALDADDTVDNEPAVIGNYIFFGGGSADGNELWVYEHYDPIE